MNEPQKPPIGQATEERIVSVIKSENEATRRHISSVFNDVDKELGYTKTAMRSLVRLVKRLLGKFGIGTEDIH